MATELMSPATAIAQKLKPKCSAPLHTATSTRRLRSAVGTGCRKRTRKASTTINRSAVNTNGGKCCNAEASLKDKSSKIVVERGQIVKVSKDAKGIITREELTTGWTDWIDYWSVDFDFENKREIIRVQTPDSNEWEEVWSGDYIFENEWQSFRTKKDRKLELTSVFHECSPGRRKIAVKVVDIFGNDTMTIIEVTVGGKN